jgi:hypothetical protein
MTVVTPRTELRGPKGCGQVTAGGVTCPGSRATQNEMVRFKLQRCC